MSVRVVIGGDVCPVGRNEAAFVQGDARAIFRDLLDEFLSADLTMVNLECPLIERPTPIVKCGPVLGANSQCVMGLKNARFDVIGLANNHILDHGEQGLRNTIRVCRQAGMAVVGAGEDLTDAGRVFCCRVKDLRIGIMAVAEQEFSIATKHTPGANPLDLIEYVRVTKKLRDECECLIVLLHGGKEYYPYPSPALQRTCRFMVEEGADAVICQHSHCPGCYEPYQRGWIVYGQGNLIFDAMTRDQEQWIRGFLVRMDISADKTVEVTFVPYFQSDGQPGASRMTQDEEAVFLRQLEERAERIQREGFLENSWNEFCYGRRYAYFSTLLGHCRLLRVLNRATHFTDILYPPRKRLGLANMVRCDTHREVLQTILAETHCPTRRPLIGNMERELNSTGGGDDTA